MFALAMAGRITGAVLWVQPEHCAERLLPSAITHILDPSRLLIAQARTEVELLWASEEALRSGAVSIVIAAPQKPLSLTAGRRLQLAAEAGRTTGLMLIRDGMGSNAVETRWHCTPEWNGGDSTLQRWHLNKNKSGTVGDWVVKWDEKARSVRVVSPAGQRCDSAASPA